jgi:hypothetical protein
LNGLVEGGVSFASGSFLFGRHGGDNMIRASECNPYSI